MFKVPEKFRIRRNTGGRIATDGSDGNNGQFIISSLKLKRRVFVQASDGDGWEHVSASIPGSKRCPSWVEMCVLKELFWDDEDFVVQMHVPKSDWVSHHPYCLHLWRKYGTNNYCERPAYLLVGPKTVTG